MKKYLSIFLAAFVFSMTGPVSAAETMGVLSFQNPQKELFPTAAEAAADAVTMILMKNRRYALIERSRIDAIISEQSLGATGAVNSSQAAEIGKISGCKYIVIGSITELRQTKGMEKKTRQTCITIGCILGVFPGIIFKAITQTRGNVVGLSLKVVDTVTGQIKYVGTGTGNDDTLEGAFNEAAKNALSKFK